MENKQTWSERLNARLQEAPGEIFKRGKWRFWFPMLIGFTILNAALTVAVFADGGSDYFWAAVVSVGGLLVWLCVGTLHYSDSEDSQLARRVSMLDSVALCFVIGHFCFLLWTYGHLITLRRADAKYESAALAYNEKAEKIQADNVMIAASAERIAAETTKVEKLKNDTAYQNRKAAQLGLRVKGARNQGGGQFPALSTAPIELEKPKAPSVSSAAFLSKWDAWIRVANFGELILAAATLIYIRNRSAAFNAKNIATINLGAGMGIPAAVAPLRRAGGKTAASVATVAEGQDSPLNALREHLRVVAFKLPGRWFKADLIAGGVAIRLCERREGREVTIKSTRQSSKLLAAVNRPDFRERLIDELIHQGFPIERGE